MEQVNLDDDNPTGHSEEEDCLYHSYQELVQWILSLKSGLTAESEDYELNKGADSAHEPALEPWHKMGHGFYHDATARLICLVDYDWSNPKHRENIHNYHPNYLVTANCWPFFLYKDEHYDPENPIKGLFKNMLLMKAFKHIFTSLSSTNFDSVPDDTDDNSRVSTAEPPLKHWKGLSDRHSCSHVASLIGMKLVAPHAIAYTAVQCC
ncbi:hypothetical protein EDC04DRAFT_2894018 [Pisolithus marmoratus]|nr:hypothetical protein EDC04DRAFT_2894018 [Pisolithus marmoratus]